MDLEGEGMAAEADGTVTAPEVSTAPDGCLISAPEVNGLHGTPRAVKRKQNANTDPLITNLCNQTYFLVGVELQAATRSKFRRLFHGAHPYLASRLLCPYAPIPA